MIKKNIEIIKEILTNLLKGKSNFDYKFNDCLDLTCCILQIPENKNTKDRYLNLKFPHSLLRDKDFNDIKTKETLKSLIEERVNNFPFNHDGKEINWFALDRSLSTWIDPEN